MPFRVVSLNVPAWPRGVVSVSPRHHWHLGPVTADRAEERSAAGCCSQSMSLEISRGGSRGSSLPQLLTRLLWREIEGFHLHYCQHLASLPSSETHSNGWRKEEGEGRWYKPDNQNNHNIFEVETSS